ncbi:GNAT family N-acetyltransferase [Mycobacterium sp. CBMA271]|uniref:GNAT family N-acetyltransferase n=1 Tax=unclassified Mycobacteroides TaxID=2618759 RepID=UPI0012DCD06D|nr:MULTISPECIES: GNAT family N-acetyltransferase [unclassified Mycobacteroides]MUM17648.1 hypothetical protein [Mycobacteroides sp. CBMA 326]MUM23077.1 GNAT family N-acetyltransferase [Mycobacteroides sp. CBMA 271]
MHSKSRFPRGVDRGPVTIDGVTVALRAPRLSDGPSWRETASRFAARLSPAFGRDDMDWESAHSPVMWADTWRAALGDAKAGGVSYVLVRIDNDTEKVVGQFSVTGRDPRTGGAEISIWSADVSPVVSRWAQLTSALSAFEGNPAIPHALIPVAVSNVRANMFASSLGWTQLQTRHQLRSYDGQISDHHIWILVNTAASRDAMRRQLLALPCARADSQPIAPRASQPLYIAAWGRYLVRRARQRLRTAKDVRPRPPVLEIPSANGEVVRLEPSSHDRYRVTMSERPAGSIDVYSDAGTSTSELVPHISSWVPEDARVAAVAQLARQLAEGPRASRRTVVTIRAGDSAIANDLVALGFIDEGDAPPSLGEEGVPRRMWTLIRG